MCVVCGTNKLLSLVCGLYCCSLFDEKAETLIKYVFCHPNLQDLLSIKAHLGEVGVQFEDSAFPSDRMNEVRPKTSVFSPPIMGAS